MALETGTYISDLVTTNPPNTDGVAQADDHLRLIKSTVKATFPNITGAVTPTHTELNYVDGVTSAIQTQLDAKAPVSSPTLTGVPAAPTASVDTNTTQLATTAYVVGQGYLKSATAASTYLTSATAASTYLPIAGTAAQAAKLSTTSGAWLGAQDSVVGMIGWKAFGNNHVVFDASAGTAPNGTTVNTTNAGTAWTPGYPNLMGWNGTSTYGLRVDSARVADSVLSGGGFTLVGSLSTTSGPTQTASGLNLTGYRQLYITYTGVSATSNGTLLCSGVIVSPASTNADTLTGVVEIDLTTGFGRALGRNAGAVGSYDGNFAITTASTSVTFGWSAAVSFDAGTITFYGVK